MRTTGYRRDGRDGLGDNGFLSIQVLLDRLPINHLIQLQQREAVDMLGNYGLCGLPEEGAHEKSPKCLDGNLGDFGGFWGILQRSQHNFSISSACVFSLSGLSAMKGFLRWSVMVLDWGCSSAPMPPS